MRAALLADRVDGHDVRVMQLGGSLGLATESFHGSGRQTQTAGKHLERHFAIERFLACFIDDAHPATAKQAQDLEIAKAFRLGQLREKVVAGYAHDRETLSGPVSIMGTLKRRYHAVQREATIDAVQAGFRDAAH